MEYKKRTLCFWCSAFGHESAELLLACLINLLPKSCGDLSVSATALLQHFGGLSGIWRVIFSPPCHWLNISEALGRLSLPSATRPYWSRGGSLSLVSWGCEFWLQKGSWKGSGTNLEAPLIRLVRTQDQIQACLRRQKRSLINSQKAS
jgi:hypothetical protein